MCDNSRKTFYHKPESPITYSLTTQTYIYMYNLYCWIGAPKRINLATLWKLHGPTIHQKKAEDSLRSEEPSLEKPSFQHSLDWMIA